jgi:hypothetical protein
MPIIEEARAHSEISQLGSFVAFIPPVDLAHRTGPRFFHENTTESFDKAAVECCVVRDNKVRVIRECRDLCRIDDLTSHHFIGDAGQRGNRRRYGTIGLP